MDTNKKDETLLRLGGVIGMLSEGDKTPEAMKALKAIMEDLEECTLESIKPVMEPKEPMKITESDKVQEEWYKAANDIKLDNLQKFIDHLLNDYIHDYGTICHALSAGAIATAWAMNNHKQGGITGFQAGAIQWEFIRHWTDKEGSLRLIDFDDMLFPQNDHYFAKTMTPETWEDLQEKAKSKLDEEDQHTHPGVRNHWLKIIDGQVPFGYIVKKEK